MRLRRAGGCLILLAVAFASAFLYEPTSAAPDCQCIQIYQPVCGSDGKTYGNSCELDCQGDGVQIDHSGECAEVACSCTAQFLPVCGTDDKTYPNKCVLDCNADPDVTIASNGTCVSAPTPAPAPAPISGPDDDSCFCTAVFDPVCGKDGHTYPNNCTRLCEGVQYLSNGECNQPKTVPCPPTSPHVNCFVDPCQVATCKKHPQATCYSNYCGETAFRGQKLDAPCSAVFVLPNDKVADCT